MNGYAIYNRNGKINKSLCYINYKNLKIKEFDAIMLP